MTQEQAMNRDDVVEALRVAIPYIEGMQMEGDMDAFDDLEKVKAALASLSEAQPEDAFSSFAESVTERSEEGDGFWQSCSGCHETFEGHDCGEYPYSKTLGCKVGAGCGECGGLGVVWFQTGPNFEADMRAMATEAQPEEGLVAELRNWKPWNELVEVDRTFCGAASGEIYEHKATVPIGNGRPKELMCRAADEIERLTALSRNHDEALALADEVANEAEAVVKAHSQFGKVPYDSPLRRMADKVVRYRALKGDSK